MGISSFPFVILFFSLLILPLFYLSLQMKDMTCLVDLLGEGEGFADAGECPVLTVLLDGLLMVAPQLSLVEFEGFLLSSLRGVCHIALVRLFDSIDI